MDYQLLLYIHIISSTLLFGTGLGTAFHGFMAHRSKNLDAILIVSRNVVLADWLFTTPAVIVQPITGVWMAHQAGFPFFSGWLFWAILLYLFVGACWLPVVWLQIRMHRLAKTAQAEKTALPILYFQYANWWFALGWPAFIAVLGIFYLMIVKPTL